MIFESLNEANERGELLLVNGGMCHWHLRRDGQLTIREIIVSTNEQGHGVGTLMLENLKQTINATSIFAKCPAQLRANDWYKKNGFVCEGEQTTRTGRKLKLWRLIL